MTKYIFYRIIKLRVLEIPDKLKDQFNGKDMFMVAATLRAEVINTNMLH